jgi:altronate hydrolase
MKYRILKVHPSDNVIVALSDLQAGEEVEIEGGYFRTAMFIPAKHKFAINSLAENEEITMYGVLVGKARCKIAAGELLTTINVRHASGEFSYGTPSNLRWEKPDVSKYLHRTFKGYQRADGSVGTGNYWLVIPMVFCENRNVETLKKALLEPLGYSAQTEYESTVRYFADKVGRGESVTEATYTETILQAGMKREQLFKHVDGIKFLTHTGGCGGTRQDSATLCGLFAGYITHGNVAGATVLSLGCQNAQVSILQEEILKRSPHFNKPLFILDQQEIGAEAKLMQSAIQKTFEGLLEADKARRAPVPLSKLIIGLECGGSDGFSGLSANPAVGYTSDLIVALGGTVILSEFPELCGVEQNIVDRCLFEADALRFSSLIKTYGLRAQEAGSGFDMNPSPGNIKDGLITDAIKSAGAAKKGGSSPVAAVLDYPEKAAAPGLNLLCTPGNDVESTTAEVAAGANIVLFTTGLGTPTGNPVVPVVKISSNTRLYERMNDIIDIDTGGIIDGIDTILAAGERILEYVIRVAGGEVKVKADLRDQDDFIPWKRGISL